MNNNIKKLTQSVVLAAMGILIATYMPIRLVLDSGVSFTLASHVPIMIAMFIGPQVAFLTGIGSALGFQLALGNIVITLRALSHLFWAIPFSLLFIKHRERFMGFKTAIFLNVIVAIFHALFEGVIVLSFRAFEIGINWQDFMKIVFIPVGIGVFVHSVVDYSLSFIIYKRIDFILLDEDQQTK